MKTNDIVQVNVKGIWKTVDFSELEKGKMVRFVRDGRKVVDERGRGVYTTSSKPYVNSRGEEVVEVYSG